ncbi:hypothetical protein Tco_0220314 [Tanacetum coccineum]
MLMLDRGIDARVVVEAVDREESEMGTRGPDEVKVERVMHPRFHDHTKVIPVHRIQAIEEVQREQGHRIVGAKLADTVLTERVAEWQRDNRRLRGTVSVGSQRVDRLQRGIARMQRELRQIRRFLLGILYNRLNYVGIIVSFASIIVSTGRRFIVVSTGSVK